MIGIHTIIKLFRVWDYKMKTKWKSFNIFEELIQKDVSCNLFPYHRLESEQDFFENNDQILISFGHFYISVEFWLKQALWRNMKKARSNKT